MIKFGSKITEKVLAYFFTNTHKKMHLRAISDALNIDSGNLSREMKKMLNSGFFVVEKIGNVKIYSLNQAHPLYKELKIIINKTIGIHGKFIKKLKKVKNILIAFVYGSFAKEKQDQFSDIDLMVIGKPGDDLVKKILDLQNEFDREINYTIFSPEGFAKALKEKEVFLEDVMENPKIFIIGNQNELEKITGK
ncbi:MAG: polymerase beta domain-containing protein [Candidatus Peregrinibacteria bacterium GW2011_GWF2_38_29]|nr:MAG: polymerase beta domain-containing protein [Candidatus Peregrinibacteria bacterium GW2011_GWF2_38_29]HBB03103.1 hypothetical protein [Candidatus Peregrinibacteria bacterium]